MKSKINQVEVNRLRKDYLFSRFVTGFGLLVLAIFAALILHILLNAAPLMKSPSINEVSHSDASAEAKSIDAMATPVTPSSATTMPATTTATTSPRSLGRAYLEGSWFNLYVDHCSFVIEQLFAQDLGSSQADATKSPIKRFAPNCDKKILGLVKQVNDDSQYVVKLNSNNILELHKLQSADILLLQYSFTIPDQYLQYSIDDWRFSLLGQQLFIHQQVTVSNYNPNNTNVDATHSVNSATSNVPKEQVDSLVLIHNLDSLNAPDIHHFDQATTVLPMLRFAQYVVVYDDKLVVHQSGEKGLQPIQSIKLNNKVISASLSPAALDLFITTSGSTIERYSFANKQGKFLLAKDFVEELPQDFAAYPSYFNFATQHDAGLLVNLQGHVIFFNMVTGDIELKRYFPGRVQFADLAGSALILGFESGPRDYYIDDWQGMISLQLLLGKNKHAGYPEPSYVWQTSVSSGSQSAKYNVVPLIMGSIKASFLALIVALPLALGAAIYTAYFASSTIRNAVKPCIEMLEAVPSVIIGFIAAVWLAPFAEQYLISIFWVLILLPFVVLSIAGIHGYLSTRLPPSKIGNWQLAINASLLVLAIVSIFSLSLLLSDWSQFGAYNTLSSIVSSVTLSKTAIVVSLALGVAIAPTLYTLIDDALYEVPEGVKQASFALGATPIQTLTKVVMVVAFPSIVSAVMLGFGRAFGETMIVLMVTGNTPIANWDLFSGLRTLTSNLTIELQEAQVDSTLFHVLFLTAAVLFAFTFLVNTIAALLKRRLNVYG